MSRNVDDYFNIQPMIDKCQTDVTHLCYLGLHQYAKENQLIGRSRPMLNPKMTPYYIKRLFFRLTVACVKQLIGTTHWDHGDTDTHQINYLNVNGYKTLRLYGLIKKDNFLSAESSVVMLPTRSYSYGLPHEQGDRDLLESDQPLTAVIPYLTPPTQAIIDIGGEIFAKHLRRGLRILGPAANTLKIHEQLEPGGGKSTVKNLAIDLELFEHPVITGLRTYIELPCHIEKVILFRNELFPTIKALSAGKDTFLYLAENWPSVEACRHTVARIHRERAQREEEGIAEPDPDQTAREEALETLRQRAQIHLGRPNIPVGVVAEGPGDELELNLLAEDGPCLLCGHEDVIECDCCLECNAQECLCCDGCLTHPCICDPSANLGARIHNVLEQVLGETHEGPAQLRVLASVHERLRAPQRDCRCPYCTGYRAGTAEEGD